MSITLNAVSTAVAPGISTSVGATGGSSPYVYSLAPGGIGGSIDSSTGLYTAPTPSVSGVDTVVVVDAASATTSLPIVVGSALILLMDILLHEMGLSQQNIWTWDQKQRIPTDSQLYIAVSAFAPKSFGNSNTYNYTLNTQVQSVNMQTNVQIDIFSRSTAALDRKEEIVMAFNSLYAQQQMAMNSFSVARLSNSFVNLSEVDGNAILYRYAISVNLQYFVQKIQVAPYFSSFSVSLAQTEP